MLLFCCFKVKGQQDTLSLWYKFERCKQNRSASLIFAHLQEEGISKKEILNIGSFISYHGNDQCGNELMNLCIAKNDSITAGDWHTYSVQNTKNGNYAEAIQALNKSLAINAKEMEGYYGWVLLYYYRDYEKSLKHLNHYDDLTPQDVDAPVGENIHFLKGLCLYQMGEYQNAINEFKINEKFEISHFKQKYVNAYIYFYIARCYEKLNNNKETELFYKKAIKQAQFPVEANFYLGTFYTKNNKSDLGEKYLQKALKFIDKGYKQQDVYVELFDEVYKTQISEALMQARK